MHSLLYIDKNKKKRYLFFLLIVVLFYGITIKNKYSLDDDYVTSTNFTTKGKDYTPNNSLTRDGFKGIPKIWQSRYAHDSESSFDYRPVTTTSFAIEYGLFGQNPYISHLINVLLYFFTICLVYESVIKLFEKNNLKKEIAFLTSILFLIHPLHTEVVSSLKSRDEILALLFSLLFLIKTLMWYDDKKIKHLLFATLFIFLAFFSKQSGVLFIAAVPLAFIFFKKMSKKQIIILCFLLIIAFDITSFFHLLFITEAEVRNYYHFENILFTDNITFFERFIFSINTFGFYIKMLIFPYHLKFYYGVNSVDFINEIGVYFTLTIAFLCSAFYYYYKTKNSYFLFALLLFIGFTLPFLNIITPVAGIVAERLTYFSSLGFVLMLSIIIAPYFQNFKFDTLMDAIKKPAIYILVIVIFCMFYVNQRNTKWYNKLTLFENDIPFLSKSAKANSMLANEYFEMLRSPNKKYSDQVLVQKCIKHYAAAVAADSSLYSAYNNAGVVYYSYLNDIPTAKKYFTLALRFKEKYAQAAENMGNCYMQENNFEKSNYFYKLSISYNPKQYSAYISYIKLLFAHNKHDESINTCLTANAIFPNDYELTAQTANSYLLKGDTLTSIKFYENAYSIAPNKNLAQFLTKKFTEIKDFNKAALYNNK